MRRRRKRDMAKGAASSWHGDDVEGGALRARAQAGPMQGPCEMEGRGVDRGDEKQSAAMHDLERSVRDVRDRWRRGVALAVSWAMVVGLVPTPALAEMTDGSPAQLEAEAELEAAQDERAPEDGTQAADAAEGVATGQAEVASEAEGQADDGADAQKAVIGSGMMLYAGKEGAADDAAHAFADGTLEYVLNTADPCKGCGGCSGRDPGGTPGNTADGDVFQ